MKFGQVKKYSNKNYAENEVRGLVPNLLLVFKKTWYEVKASGLQLSLNIL